MHYRRSRFCNLMGIQWLACVLVGAFITPLTWMGQFSGSLENALVGLIFGGLFALPPIYCAWTLPGQKGHSLCRCSRTGLFFNHSNLSFGEGESKRTFTCLFLLAALAFYKDISVLWVATFVVIADHAVRGFLLPMSHLWRRSWSRVALA